MIIIKKWIPTISCIAMLFCSSGAIANEEHKEFFKSIEGNWSGPGEIVAGKYKGTVFTCDLKGFAPFEKIGISLNGSCRVGIFKKEMKAVIFHNGTQYTGIFNEGAKGDGLDVTSGDVSSDHIIVGLNRRDLYGAMLLRAIDDDKINATVSVRVGDKLIPVIGLKLNRIKKIVKN